MSDPFAWMENSPFWQGLSSPTLQMGLQSVQAATAALPPDWVVNASLPEYQQRLLETLESSLAAMPSSPQWAVGQAVQMLQGYPMAQAGAAANSVTISSDRRAEIRDRLGLIPAGLNKSERLLHLAGWMLVGFAESTGETVEADMAQINDVMAQLVYVKQHWGEFDV